MTFNRNFLGGFQFQTDARRNLNACGNFDQRHTELITRFSESEGAIHSTKSINMSQNSGGCGLRNPARGKPNRVAEAQPRVSCLSFYFLKPKVIGWTLWLYIAFACVSNVNYLVNAVCRLSLTRTLLGLAQLADDGCRLKLNVCLCVKL